MKGGMFWITGGVFYFNDIGGGEYWVIVVGGGEYRITGVGDGEYRIIGVGRGVITRGENSDKVSLDRWCT